MPAASMAPPALPPTLAAEAPLAPTPVPAVPIPSADFRPFTEAPLILPNAGYISSSFDFGVPADEAAAYQEPAVVAMLERSISSAVHAAPNQVQITSLGLGGAAATAVRRLTQVEMQQLRAEYNLQGSPAQQEAMLVAAQELGSPTSAATARFARSFANATAGTALTPIAPASMTPGLTQQQHGSGSLPPPPPPEEAGQAQPMAASGSLAIFVVCAVVLVGALGFFILSQRTKGTKPPRRQASPREFARGNADEEAVALLPASEPSQSQPPAPTPVYAAAPVPVHSVVSQPVTVYAAPPPMVAPVRLTPRQTSPMASMVSAPVVMQRETSTMSSVSPPPHASMHGQGQVPYPMSTVWMQSHPAPAVP